MSSSSEYNLKDLRFGARSCSLEVPGKSSGNRSNKAKGEVKFLFPKEQTENMKSISLKKVPLSRIREIQKQQIAEKDLISASGGKEGLVFRRLTRSSISSQSPSLSALPNPQDRHDLNMELSYESYLSYLGRKALNRADGIKLDHDDLVRFARDKFSMKDAVALLAALDKLKRSEDSQLTCGEKQLLGMVWNRFILENPLKAS